MCGIVCACAKNDVVETLLDGLQKLEYRGYDSAGIAVIQNGNLCRRRELGKVQQLKDQVSNKLFGTVGLAHTRWATHGSPTVDNAHPHISHDRIAVVHNGIIENYSDLKLQLIEEGYRFSSETDTEVIAHTIHYKLSQGLTLIEAVKNSIKTFKGAYGLAVVDKDNPERIVVARSGSPLVIGHSAQGNYVASDQAALTSVVDNVTYLEEGDVAEISSQQIKIYNSADQIVSRNKMRPLASDEAHDKNGYDHFMLKEIYEQAEAVQSTLKNRIIDAKLAPHIFGVDTQQVLEKTQHIQIVACGTSYNAGLIAKSWFEEWGSISCNVDIASEFRYKKGFVHPNSLLITISQSGETADTLAALRIAKAQGYFKTLTFCNIATSSMVRESDLVYLMNAGPEIGVASTKAFTVQLVGLQLLLASLVEVRSLEHSVTKQVLDGLQNLPSKIKQVCQLAKQVERVAQRIEHDQHALFLGRGTHYPVAIEGALKLKEISYIHAEAYASGELKHGPLALVDESMPVVALVPKNFLFDKIKSNLAEVQARGGRLIVLAEESLRMSELKIESSIRMPDCSEFNSPILYTIPLQLLAYYAALKKGCDVDQPRNLAKSVTVE